MLKSLDKIHDISRQASDQSTRNDYKVHISEIEKGQNYIQELKYNLNRINYIERKAAARPYKEKNEELKRKLAASASSIIRKIHLIDGLTLIHEHWRTVPIEKRNEVSFDDFAGLILSREYHPSVNGTNSNQSDLIG
ncbi:MAG: hypothetical protein ACK5BI_08695 [Burkholderiales bacterium]